jgi:hypothetical protein
MNNPLFRPTSRSCRHQTTELQTCLFARALSCADCGSWLDANEGAVLDMVREMAHELGEGDDAALIIRERLVASGQL